MEKKAMMGSILAIISVILIGVSLAMPWYAIHDESRDTYDGDTDTSESSTYFYFDHVEWKNSYGGNEESDEESYSEIEDEFGDEESEIINTFQTTQILDILALVFVIVAFLGALILEWVK